MEGRSLGEGTGGEAGAADTAPTGDVEGPAGGEGFALSGGVGSVFELGHCFG
jgi:hypothetical protein